MQMVNTTRILKIQINERGGCIGLSERPQMSCFVKNMEHKNKLDRFMAALKLTMGMQNRYFQVSTQDVFVLLLKLQLVR